MLDLRRHDVTLFRPRFQHAANSCVVAFGTATGENDFHWIGGANELGNLRPCVSDSLTNLAAEAVNARRIAVMLREKRQHYFRNLGQHPSGRVVIEVNFPGHKCFS